MIKLVNNTIRINTCYDAIRLIIYYFNYDFLWYYTKTNTFSIIY